MIKTEPVKRLIVIKKPLKTTCYTWFSAPYSLSAETTLPEGMLLNLTEYEGREEPYRFTASPVDSIAWAPFVVPTNHRCDKNFRGNYEFHLHSDEIRQYTLTVSEAPDKLSRQLRFSQAIHGSLFGTAIGDSIGLPYEGLSSKRLAKFNYLPLRQRFLFGRGMLSDDTEHSCIIADALIYSNENIKEFSSNLAWSLRFWFLGLPAGIGMATLKACLKLWCFFPANRSGVFSAGNGPAMRSAILGVYACNDQKLRHQLVEISTHITHTDPKALKGALIVAEFAARNTIGKPLSVDDCITEISDIIGDDDELRNILLNAIESARLQQSALDYCRQNNQIKGVGGYIYHTLPVVMQIVLRNNDDFEVAITEAVSCGGDTDTVAAIVGGIIGANVGKAGIPTKWLDNLMDWPRNKQYLDSLANELAAVRWQKQPGRTRWMDPIRLWLRNGFFMIWVLAHGFRRLLPPY